MRKKIIAGNWKMNKTPSAAVAWAKELSAKINAQKNDVVFCVPAVCLVPVIDALKSIGSGIEVGAENLFYEENGAFTGEISAEMLTDIGVKYVIIGHSERRSYFAETDETVNKKVLKALSHKLTPIVCVGETLPQRERGITIDLLRLQTKIALYTVPASEAAGLIIAYEPIWAIGTGKTATNDQAEEACKAIRQVVSEIYDDATAEKIRIQYGGSVTAQNAGELFAMPNIDGGLVGGASLKAEFVDITG